MKYMSPEIKFKSLKLSESIAVKCWGEATPNEDYEVGYKDLQTGKTYQLMLLGPVACNKTSLVSVGVKEDGEMKYYGPGTDIYAEINSIFTSVPNHGNDTDASGFTPDYTS